MFTTQPMSGIETVSYVVAILLICAWVWRILDGYFSTLSGIEKVSYIIAIILLIGALIGIKYKGGNMSLFEIMIWLPIIMMAGLIGIVLSVGGILLMMMFGMWFIGMTISLITDILNLLIGWMGGSHNEN